MSTEISRLHTLAVRAVLDLHIEARRIRDRAVERRADQALEILLLGGTTPPRTGNTIPGIPSDGSDPRGESC